jgi:hypothetical protein
VRSQSPLENFLSNPELFDRDGLVPANLELRRK